MDDSLEVTTMSLSPAQVLASYSQFNSEFIRLNLSKIRESANKKVKYIDVEIKNNGKYVPLKIKVLNEKVSNGVSSPEDRKYEQIKLSFREDTEFSKAMRAISETFTELVNELRSSKKITTSPKDAKSGCVLMPSVEPKGPVQETVVDQDGNFKELDTPICWVNIPFKRYKDLTKLETLDFSYKEGNTPFIVKKFDVAFKNLTSGEILPADLDNVTICDDLTRGSIISGTVKMYCVVSNQGGFCLKTEFSSNLYYITGDSLSGYKDDFEDDDLGEMMALAKSRPAPTANSDENNSDDIITDGAGGLDGLDEIEGLSLE
jgi:hypothetical protein